MPREKTPKRQESSSGGPRNANPLFSKDLGQHILKNPLVVNGIIEKVICEIIFGMMVLKSLPPHLRQESRQLTRFWKLDLVLEI